MTDYGLWPGDVMLSMNYGNQLSRLIGKLQGRPGPDQSAPLWSHTAVCIGGDMMAEATLPKGRIIAASHYFGAEFLACWYRIPGLRNEQRERVAQEAKALAGRPYDKLNILRHLVDNLVERLTWNPKTQHGYRPLARLVADGDGERQLVCSELVERAYFRGASVVVNPGYVIGEARPLDVWHWLQKRGARLVLQSTRGTLLTGNDG